MDEIPPQELEILAEELKIPLTTLQAWYKTGLLRKVKQKLRNSHDELDRQIDTDLVGFRKQADGRE